MSSALVDPKEFTVSVVVETVTPESAEQGDIDSSDTDDTTMSLREFLKHAMMCQVQVDRCAAELRVSLYEHDANVNYRTGAEHTTSYHARFPKGDAMGRAFVRGLKLAKAARERADKARLARYAQQTAR